MPKIILFAALSWATLGFAQTPDDDDDDAPAVAAPKAGQPTAKPDAPAPAAALRSDKEPSAETGSLSLVSGAPLNNPNVGVHIVEKKEASDAKRLEVILYPLAMQVNGKFTQHFGSMASVVYHLQENFGLQLTGGYNWANSESSFNSGLVDNFRAEAQAATSLLWTWGLLGGLEVTPIYGKFAFFEGTLVRFSFVINGGVGLGGTRHQLKPETVRGDGSISPSTFGDTGLKFMGSLGAGFRVQIGDHFAIRLEVRDVVYTARVERVNGCDATDLLNMRKATEMGRDPATATTGASCNVDTFTGTYEDSDIKRSNDVPLAYNLVKAPSSDVLNNIGLYLGVSFTF